MLHSNIADATTKYSARSSEKIAIVGAGWFGVHTALKLAEEGYEVHLYDVNAEIFSGISGTYGIRLHKGLHYPRSEGTQASCREGYEIFTAHYSALLGNRLKHAVYAYKAVSDNKIPSKASLDQFKAAAEKAYYSKKPQQIEIGTPGYPYKNIDLMYNVPEPVIKTGEPLREYFTAELEQAGVILHLATKVLTLTRSIGLVGAELLHNQSEYSVRYDKVIISTAYKDFLPKDVSSELFEVRYQPLVSIIYRQKMLGDPVTFIVMDLNDYPCLMHRTGGEPGEHILTHDRWTTLGSFATLEEAQQMVADMTLEKYQEVCRHTQESMISFYPSFLDDFEFVRFEQAVTMPKIRSDVEFRRSVVFEDLEGLIHIFRGKVNNIFDAAEQVLELMRGESLLSSPSRSFRYTMSSPLKEYFEEVFTIPFDLARSTCDTNPYPHWGNPALKEQLDTVSQSADMG